MIVTRQIPEVLRNTPGGLFGLDLGTVPLDKLLRILYILRNWLL